MEPTARLLQALEAMRKNYGKVLRMQYRANGVKIARAAPEDGVVRSSMEQLRMSKENTILVQCIRHEPEDMRSLNYDMEDILRHTEEGFRRHSQEGSYLTNNFNVLYGWLCSAEGQ